MIYYSKKAKLIALLSKYILEVGVYGWCPIVMFVLLPTCRRSNFQLRSLWKQHWSVRL